MEFENLLTLIKTVSDSDLTDFAYEENGTSIHLKKKKETVVVTGNSSNVPGIAKHAKKEKRNRCGFWHFFKCTGYGTPNSAAVGTDHGIRSKDGERYCRW